MKRIVAALMLVALGTATGCTQTKHYGAETSLTLPAAKRQVWAVAPAIDLSGQGIEAILQADLLFAQVQQVRGITAVPVNRVVDVYSSLRIEKVESEEQAQLVCDLLGCDGLLVPTITIYDPYDPPKVGASLTLMGRGGSAARQANVKPEDLVRQSRGDQMQTPAARGAIQAVGMFDAANGSTRDAAYRYAQGRNDPLGPFAEKEYLVSMDRYSGFVYHQLISELLSSPRLRR